MTSRIKNLIIYPIKGMKGVEVKSAKLTPRGFEHDRRYMLVDAQHGFISQRTHSFLGQVEVEILDDDIHITYNGSSVSFSTALTSGEKLTVSLFEHQLSVSHVSDLVDRQISALLDADVKLVKMTEEDIREKQLIKGPPKTEVSLADGYPYLIIGTASIDYLNSKVIDDIHVNRFRGNLIVETKIPHEEDQWEKIQVGNEEMVVIKPCARCQVITINQENGQKTAEPTKTLATYRKDGNKINFGVNAVSLTDGYIRIGDQVVSQ